MILNAPPPLVLDASYVDRLQALASAASRRSPQSAEWLMTEIVRATLVPSSEVPDDVVNIGSRVTFRDDFAWHERTVTLVMPASVDPVGKTISVLYPLGTALLGLARGASIAWRTRSEEMRRVTVLNVRNPRGGSASEAEQLPPV